MLSPAIVAAMLFVTLAVIMIPTAADNHSSIAVTLLVTLAVLLFATLTTTLSVNLAPTLFANLASTLFVTLAVKQSSSLL